MNKKWNASLIVAVSLPVLMVVAVALSIYIPLGRQTFTGQFLYSVPQNPYSGYINGYSVANGKLQQALPPLARSGIYSSTGTFQLYVHDLASNTSRELSLDEAKALRLDPAVRSDRGFQIDYGYRDQSFFPFLFYGSTDYSAMYVKGEHGSLKLNLKLHAGNYYNQMQFIGWVKS